MPRTPEQLAAAAAETEAMLDNLDVNAAQPEDISDLRAIAAALDSVAQGETGLAVAVAQARANGRSWARIGTTLGISKQAAHDRFANRSQAAS
jgi:hypothetical protein